MKKAAGAGAAATVAATLGPGASPVPGFLAKLWALVEDSGSDDVIAWSLNGQNFCILDEQRFAKELLPKYFKHNNLSSFIRQLNIYGFRKVIALENGMMTSAESSAIEFQHPFFKRGKANLLASIKRKVSAVRSEDLKVCPEDLHKVLSEVQEMREQQNSMDLKLASMKRENKALWKEVAFLRQKHNHQQQLLSKIFEFILGLMRGNCVLGLKRKRPLTDASGASPSKYSCPYVRIPVEDCEAAAISEHSPDCEDSVIIRDITDAQEEEEDGGTEKLLALAHASNGNREEIQDFLNCIDTSLEELQAMLPGKKFNYASDTLTEAEDLPESLDAIGMNERETSGKNDMQLLQYRGNPLLSLFEEPPSNDDACKTEDAEDVLLPSLEKNRPSGSLPVSGESPQQALDPESQADGTFSFEPLDQPLLSEDTNGEYKLFPLLLLSPVANFIEEASEIETS